MAIKLLQNLAHGGELIALGNIVEGLADKLEADLVARGIAEYSEEEATHNATPNHELKSTTGNLATEDGPKSLHAAANTDSAVAAAAEANRQEEEAKRQQAGAPVDETDTTPSAPAAPVAPTTPQAAAPAANQQPADASASSSVASQPTAEEIAATLESTGGAN